jgi:hypothetical protein
MRCVLVGLGVAGTGTAVKRTVTLLWNTSEHVFHNTRRAAAN